MDFSLSTEQERWQQIAREFAQSRVEPIAREMDARREMPIALVREMASLGLLGSTLPSDLGGSEMDNLSLALVYEELGRACSSVRGFMTVHSSLVMQCINTWANEEQKHKYLPSLAKGELIGCYALTEPEAGSDAASIRATATRTADGYTLRGEKIWITNGNIAGIAIVFASLSDIDDQKPHKKITAFLVQLDSTGVKREPMSGEELGHRASDHAHITFEDCRVSNDMVLGGEGNGFKVAMSALDHGRLGVAAGALGVHQACLDASLAFVRQRRQFGQRIADFEMVQSAIAEINA
jgi:alkylation response protein AidB-like acyl-CoA dehydrogenase